MSKVKAVFICAVLLFVIAGTVAACQSFVGSNAVVNQGVTVYNNPSMGRNVADLDSGARVEITRRDGDMCHAVFSGGEGWLECVTVSLDDGVVITEGLTSGGGDAESSCSLSSYRAEAEALMNRFSRIAKDTSLRDSSSRQMSLTSLNALQAEINRLMCKSEFPLKHETLEFAVKHTIDAIELADEGKYLEANQSLDRALLNVERFNDWTVDIERP